MYFIKKIMVFWDVILCR